MSEPSSFTPSGSTVASVAIGVPVATIVSWIVNTFTGVVMPGGVEAALGALIGALVGFFFVGGRKDDTV